jgi:hypothetical protein
MESFEDIRQKEFAHLTGEIGALGLAYVKELLTEPTNLASGDSKASRKED